MGIPRLRFKGFSDEWVINKLNEVSTKITDGTHDTPKPTAAGIPYLTAIHIKDGWIDYKNCYYLPQAEHDKIYQRCNPEIGDLLLVNIGAGTATCAINSVEYPFSLKNVALIKPNRKLLNSLFLEQIQRKNSKKQFHQLTSGGAQPFLSLKEIGRFKLFLPSLPEQEKIAQFLVSIDKKLEALKKKKELLEQYKKGVMQKIFSRELRFKDEEGKDFPEWEEKELGDLIEEVVDKTKFSNQHRILSSTAKGLFNQDEYFTRDIASKDNSGYKILRKDQLVFSPQNLWLGNINVNTTFEVGIVSPSYKIFSFINIHTTASFCKYFLLTPKMMFQYEQCSEQGASVVRRNLDMSLFLKIYIQIPSLPEQEKIADFLTALDDKIALVERQIEKTEFWKKGLLQQMFV